MKIYGDKLIEGKGATSGLQKVRKAEKKEGSSYSAPVKQGDKVQISSRSKEISDLLAVVAGLPETRDDKVNAIKNAIKSGNYSVDSGKIAARILKEL